MVVILPVLWGIALGVRLTGAVVSVAVALGAVAVVLFLSVHHGERVSRAAFSDSDEINLLTVLGAALLVAGLAEMIHVSAAVRSSLVGIGISGPAAHRAESLLATVRDLFAAVFFIIAGLGIAAGGSSRQSVIAAGHVLLTATLGPIMALAAERWPLRESWPAVDPLPPAA